MTKRKPQSKPSDLPKVKIGIVGGTGFKHLLDDTEKLRLQTPYGEASPLHIGKMSGKTVVFLQRHGSDHSIPPHRISYRANIYALHEAGVERILATNAVGAIDPSFRPGDIVAPHDFVDFTKHRATTFYDRAPVTHVDFSQPYCVEIREQLVEAAKKLGLQVWNEAVLVCTEGPRYETPAEIEMFRRLGCDIVGMTGVPEAVLARELEMCYAPVCFVSNMAAGMQKQLTIHEVSKMSRNALPKMKQILTETIKTLRSERNCQCANALEYSRLE